MPRSVFIELLSDAILDLEEMRELSAELPERDSQSFESRIDALLHGARGLLMNLCGNPAHLSDH